MGHGAERLWSGLEENEKIELRAHIRSMRCECMCLGVDSAGADLETVKCREVKTKTKGSGGTKQSRAGRGAGREARKRRAERGILNRVPISMRCGCVRLGVDSAGADLDTVK